MKTLSLIILTLLFWLPTSHANATPQNGTQLVLLGTAGGPATKRNRSQPANAVVVNGDIYILDAGDGVAGQLTLAGLSVADVRAVFITRNHSDHMADYGTLLLRSWLTGRRETIQTFGYRFDTADKSIVFSGDTSPNENVVEAAQGVDILVHEVLNAAAIEAMTPDNATLRQHLFDIHTNTDEVGEIATRAGVKMLVLSHFGGSGHPLYDRREVWEEAVRKTYSGPLIVGEDLTIIE